MPRNDDWDDDLLSNPFTPGKRNFLNPFQHNRKLLNSLSPEIIAQMEINRQKEREMEKSMDEYIRKTEKYYQPKKTTKNSKANKKPRYHPFTNEIIPE